jgi:hypothetical protein
MICLLIRSNLANTVTRNCFVSSERTVCLRKHRLLANRKENSATFVVFAAQREIKSKATERLAVPVFGDIFRD